MDVYTIIILESMLLSYIYKRKNAFIKPMIFFLIECIYTWWFKKKMYLNTNTYCMFKNLTVINLFNIPDELTTFERTFLQNRWYTYFEYNLTFP